MDAKVYLTQKSFESLLTHLVNFEEQKDSILDEYFPHLNQERLEAARLIGKYNEKLAQIIRNIVTSDEADSTFPWVIIGSHVVIRDLASQEIFTYTISGPYQDISGWDSVSYLSPVGRALLLKKAGDMVTVQTPGGKYEYEILSITYGQAPRQEERTLS